MNTKNDVGYSIKVCDNFGIHDMKPEDFLEYDERMQVSAGEESHSFFIYCVYMINEQDTIEMVFNWKEAQQYFESLNNTDDE